MNKLFDSFWKEYPKKVGKKQCKVYWAKLKPSKELFTIIMDGLTSQNKMRKLFKEEDMWCPNPPDPIRWLKYERWEDDLPEIEIKKIYKPPKYKNHEER